MFSKKDIIEFKKKIEILKECNRDKERFIKEYREYDNEKGNQSLIYNNIAYEKLNLMEECLNKNDELTYSYAFNSYQIFTEKVENILDEIEKEYLN